MKYERYYFIDWLRVVAIALLILYHVIVVFQPYGQYLWFIQNGITLPFLDLLGSMFSIWRIPLLFFVSGLGVYFAMRRRTISLLVKERTRRILIPLLFGSLFIVPLHRFLFMSFYNEPLYYHIHFSFLWFLFNIYVYVLIFLGVFYYFKKYPDNIFIRFGNNLLNISPLFVYSFGVLFLLEGLFFSSSMLYDTYHTGYHGFLLGLFIFLTGFYIGTLEEKVFVSLYNIRFPTFTVATVLLINRMFLEILVLNNHFLTALESLSWIFTLLGFFYSFANVKSSLLSYLATASYPIYIVHMIFLYSLSYSIVPLSLNVWVKFASILIGTILLSFLCYHFIIRRIGFFKIFFGLKHKE